MEQQVTDLDLALSKVCYDPNCDKLKDSYLKQLPCQLKLLSNYLGQRPFVAGPNISYVDFLLYEYLKKISTLISGSLAEYSNLSKLVDRIEAFPQIAAYIKSQLPRPFYTSSVKWDAIL